MFDSIKLGQYLPGDSWYYRLDPRNKLILTTFFIVIVFLANNLLTYGLVAFFALGIILTSGVALKHFYRSIRPVMILMAFTFVINLFFIRSGELVANVPVIRIYSNIERYHWVALGAALGLFGLAIVWKRFRKRPLSLWRVFKSLFLFSLIVHGALMWGIRDKGTLVWEWTFPIYDDALWHGGFIILRLVLIISMSSLLTFTTKPTDLTLAIERVLSPLKLFRVQVNELALMISIALRFIPTLLEESQKILKAQTSRGADFSEGNLKDKVLQIISLLIPMFIISFKRAEDLANAMEARGYVPGQKRTSLRVLKWHVRDTLIMVTFILLCGFVLFLRG